MSDHSRATRSINNSATDRQIDLGHSGIPAIVQASRRLLNGAVLITILTMTGVNETQLQPIPETRRRESDEESIVSSVAGQSVASLMDGMRNSALHWKILLLGQVLSVLVSTQWASQSTLHLVCNWQAPTLSTGVVYLILSMHLVPLILRGRRLKREVGNLDDKQRWFLRIIPTTASPWVYAGMALLSVEANFLYLMAIQYTTVTSISIFDSLSIPTAIALSAFFLGRKYRPVHLVGG